MRTLWDIVTFMFACGFFLLVAATMLFTRRLTPRVGVGRFLLGIIRRRTQPA